MRAAHAGTGTTPALRGAGGCAEGGGAVLPGHRAAGTHHASRCGHKTCRDLRVPAAQQRGKVPPHPPRGAPSGNEGCRTGAGGWDGQERAEGAALGGLQHRPGVLGARWGARPRSAHAAGGRAWAMHHRYSVTQHPGSGCTMAAAVPSTPTLGKRARMSKTTTTRAMKAPRSNSQREGSCQAE